ncbi:acyl-CoA dehydrogenase NM domain-like protein [Tilletiopsis washingtonensis]|uniref:Acyl-CoA dehydrogenase NM domain-like protein n=1 Tax=Tilletiopsis washingtonensis TaxID=58919 RepID=A0A316ZIR8_9BASI|nr:acyl-CoA dehydrogenase NM domain-like protein [Tilletiopsis washingtonensis]PWO01430.1 acyl-CoA dehydrogenase NM domain-like protein [Tilletiopsis washingtonensis]
MAAQKQQELKSFSREEVAKHNKPGDLWIIIDAKVYNLSKFAELHPGGESVLYDEEVAGQEATETFFGLHLHEVLLRPSYSRLVIGTIKGEESVIVPDELGAPSKVPYAEPMWLSQNFHSPYYNDSHRRLQREMRAYVDETVYEVAQRCEANGKRPDVELIKDMGKRGINAMRMGPGKHLHGRTLMAGVKGEEFDYFHELVITQELVRMGARGFGDGLQGGMVIGLPPVMNFGSQKLKDEVIEPVLAGEKFICLAISEAFAGSDVMGLRTFAKKSEDGSHYIVNGTKKWITNGTFADYFTTAVKTDEGFAVLLIRRDFGGVETKQIKTSYSTTAGTAYVTFDNVKVPSEYVIGEDGMGIQIVLSNFNHERWVMCCSTIRSSRAICEVLMKWTSQRKAFGKPLNSQAVVRGKLAGIISEAEAAQNWLESVTYQMCKMSYKQQSLFLAGQVALLKSWSTRVSNDIADVSVNLAGGRGLTQSGMGKMIEMFARTSKFDAVLGGSEEILADLGIRQALRLMPENAKL